MPTPPQDPVVSPRHNAISKTCPVKRRDYQLIDESASTKMAAVCQVAEGEVAKAAFDKMLESKCRNARAIVRNMGEILVGEPAAQMTTGNFQRRSV